MVVLVELQLALPRPLSLPSLAPVEVFIGEQAVAVKQLAMSFVVAVSVSPMW